MRRAAGVMIVAVLWLAPAALAAPGKPNLRPSAPAAVTLRPAEPVTVAVTVRNGGRAAARASRMVVSLDRTRLGAQPHERLRLGSLKLKRLRPGARATARGRFAMPSLAAGRYRLRVCVDAAKRVRESSERDNCAARRVTLESGPAARPQPGTENLPPAPEPVPVPQDPEQTVPALDPGAATSVYDATRFL